MFSQYFLIKIETQKKTFIKKKKVPMCSRQHPYMLKCPTYGPLHFVISAISEAQCENHSPHELSSLTGTLASMAVQRFLV